MATLPQTITVRCQKALREAGLSDFTLDFTKMSDAGLVDLLQAGAYTRHTAGTTHISAKRKDKGEAAPKLEDWQNFTREFIAKYEAPEFASRARSEAGEDALSLEEKALVMALETKFSKVEAIRRANKKKGIEAITVLDLIDKHGAEDDSFEEAARKAAYAVGSHYLQTKHGTNPNLIPEKMAKSWKEIQTEAKKHLESLKLRASNGKAAKADDDNF